MPEAAHQASSAPAPGPEGPGPVSLTADQRRRYLVDGYLELQPSSLGPDDHRHLYRRAGELYAESGVVGGTTAHLDILGDNLRARIPELDRLLADPVVDGALTDLLGPDYLLHPHSYCHRSERRDQVFHQDGNLPWNERGHYRAHRPDWALLFYYPQAVDHRNGPTEVVVGSQYWTVDNEDGEGGWHPGDRIARTIDDDAFGSDDRAARDRIQARALSEGLAVPGLRRRYLHLAPGTVVLAHYDLIHRGSRVEGADRPRYLYKFYFARVREPAPIPDPALSLDLASVDPRIRPVVAAQERWLAGIGPAGRAGVDGEGGDQGAIEAALRSGREDQKVEAAYRLGLAASAGADRALETLAAGLWAEAESTRRAAGHGLRQAGPAGVPLLLAGLASASAPVRRPAVAGLGTVTAAGHPDAIRAVVDALASDSDDLVRSNAAYALGQMGRAADVDPEPMARALLDRLAPGAESDNAFGAGLRRSTIRQSAAFALVQLVANHRLSEAALSELIEGPLRDGDRYVQGLIAEAVARAEGLPPDLARAVISYLAGRRWNRSPGEAV